MNAKFLSNMLTSWLKRTHCRTGSLKRRSQKSRSWVPAEVLEIRQVPAATAVLQAGVLTITGSDQADNIVVTKSGTNLVVSGVTTAFASRNVRSIVVNAGGGNDTVDLSAVSLPTKVFGGEGHDSLTGGTGNDTLMGEAGNDVLRGSAGNDSLIGGADLDLIREIANANFVLTNAKLTGSGTDTLREIETASLEGGVGKNKLDAAIFSGSVTLHGGAGNDTLTGGSANDEVFGGAGDDIVDGKAGIDLVDGVGRDVTKNSERLVGLLIEGVDHRAGEDSSFVAVSKWGDAKFGTPAIVTYSFMASGVHDANSLDDFNPGWTNSAISEFMPPGAIAEIQRAFAAWTQVANIRFVEVPDTGEAFGASSRSDIRIGGHLLDGPRTILAHAHFPPPSDDFRAGDIHFDVGENWAVRSLNGDPNTVDIFTVAAHEIGHSIGLGHSGGLQPILNNDQALMNPIYSEDINGPQADDIRGAQALYGLPGAPPVVQVSVSDAQITEGNQGTTNVVFTVTLSDASTQPIQVDYTTANGTAVAGSDYVATLGSLVFRPGEISKTVTVSVRGDTDFELNEAFSLRLTTSQATLADAEGQATILNDDRDHFALHTGTLFQETGANFTFLTTDWNRDGHVDLVGIGMNGTGSRTTEVHILSGATNYQTWLLQTGTLLGESNDQYEFDMGDWNRDGRADLFVIQKQGTGSRSTEVHVLDGASNFQNWLLHTGTALHETGSTFDFKVADWNRDGRVDVVAIITSQTASGTVEVHVLDGASTFQAFSLHTGTALADAGTNFDFEVSDVDRDGITDLVALQKTGTGSRTTELHVLSGRSVFQSFIVHSATGLAEAGAGFEFDYSNGQIYAIQKSGTGTRSTEVHIPLLIASAAPPAASQSAAPFGYFDLGANGNLWGYTVDPTTPGVSTLVEVVVDGQPVNTINSDIRRDDVNSLNFATGNHGFSYFLPSRYFDGNPHRIDVYALDTSNTDRKSLLGGSGVIFRQDPRPEIAVNGVTDGQTTPLDFGTVNLGSVSPTMSFTVRNVGTGTLTIGPMSLPNGFVVPDGLPASLAPGQSDVLTVRLNTTTAGSFGGTITIATNDPNRHPFDFVVAGIVRQ